MSSELTTIGFCAYFVLLLCIALTMIFTYKKMLNTKLADVVFIVGISSNIVLFICFLIRVIFDI